MHYDFDTPTHREHTHAEKYQKRQKLFGTQDVYPMWVADMEFATAPCIVNALQKQVAHKVFGYEEPSLLHYEACATWLDEQYAVKISPDAVRMSPSIMTTMSIAISALSAPSDGVTLFTPVYTPFITTVKNLNRTLLDVPFIEDEHFGIDTQAFERSMQQSKLLLLCNPHNPVGKIFTPDELAYILDIAQRYDVTIISDDAHADIVRSEATYTPIVAVNEHAKKQCVVLGGIGKGFNVSGLGATYYYSYNKTLLDAVDDGFEKAHIVRANALGLVVFHTALTQGHAWLNALNTYIDTNIAYTIKTINQTCAPLRAIKPEGTYLVWINCEGLGMGDKALKEFFVHEVGIGLSLGRLFGKGGTQHMRMNVAVPHAKLKEVLAQLHDALVRRHLLDSKV